ncbi:MAG: DUF2281 domain-containing protein [Oscillospiraceae bacterium]|nr:DUF2281 domain-containing protein [Oscillospiraceae bacterium]
MTSKQDLIKEIESLPYNFVDEAYRYISFLKQFKNKVKAVDITLASEQSLAEEWLLPEEDNAWENL